MNVFLFFTKLRNYIAKTKKPPKGGFFKFQITNHKFQEKPV